MKIRGLVFDFDGLILDTETPIIEAWASVHEEAGLIFDRLRAYELVGHIDLPFDPWTAFPLGHDRAALEREHSRRRRQLLERQTLLPGVEDYLSDARALQLKLAVASNSDHAWVDGHLRRLGLFGSFDSVCCRDDVARGKPEPDVYLAAVRSLGLEPREAVAFEDSVPGVTAAARAGLHVVAVPNRCTVHCKFERAHLRLHALTELRLVDLLRRLEGSSRLRADK